MRKLLVLTLITLMIPSGWVPAAAASDVRTTPSTEQPDTAVWGTRAPDKSHISSDLKGADGDVDVVIQFTVPPGQAQHDKVKNKGGKLKRDLRVIKGAAYTIPAG